jgi:hypothetical protein
MEKIIRIIMIGVGLFAVFCLVNAFGGQCTKKCGVSNGKHTLQGADGKRFYRIYVKGDSGVLDVQTQEEDYPLIDMGDSVCYEIRYGLFTNTIIETFNAKCK